MKPVPHVCPTCGAALPSTGTGVFTCKQCGSTYRVEPPVQPVQPITYITNNYHAAPAPKPAPKPAPLPVSVPPPNPGPSILSSLLFLMSVVAAPIGLILVLSHVSAGRPLLFFGLLGVVISLVWMPISAINERNRALGVAEPKYYGSKLAAWLFKLSLVALPVAVITVSFNETAGGGIFFLGCVVLVITIPWMLVTDRKGKRRALGLAEPKYCGSKAAQWLFWMSFVAVVIGAMAMELVKSEESSGALLFFFGFWGMVITIPWMLVTHLRRRKLHV